MSTKTKTNPEKIAILREIAERIGGRLRSYSGRGMFGEYCASIYCDDSDACIEEAVAAGIRAARCDRMGMGYVVYWPDISDEGIEE